MHNFDANISDIDLRLLRVFQSVVRYNGFSAAQQHLGLTQATISNHMNQLEERLGMRLCERGRSGFFLTEHGKLVHAAMLDLFGSLESFRSVLGSAKGELIGNLHFGTVDAMYTNPQFNLAAALGEFTKFAPNVFLDLDIATPQALNQGLLSGRYHIVLTPEQPYPKSMRSVPVMKERQMLYCGIGHPLFETSDATIAPAMLAQFQFAGRSYMNEEEICDIKFNWASVTAHMESTALLISSGQYIGFLPDHFAERWTRRNLMRALSPDVIAFNDIFHVVFRRKEQNPAAAHFAECIKRQTRMEIG